MHKLRQSIYVLLMVLLGISVQAQTVTLNVTTPEVCSGQQTAFQAVVANLPSGVSATDYEWVVSTQAPVINQQANYQFQYPPGNYTVSVKVSFSNSSSVTSTLQNFIVYHLPNAAVTVNTQTIQCFRGNMYVFTNNSTQNSGSPSNPLSYIQAGYGDGVIDSFPASTSTFSHTYNAPNTYSPFIRVVDSKGCESTLFLQTGAITVKPNIAPDFNWTFLSGPCFVSCYRFTNLSPVAKGSVKNYKWDFGDGQSFTANLANNPFNYDTITHCYTKNGQFPPALTITDTTNCTDSTRKTLASSSQPIPQNIRFEFDVVTYKGGSGPDKADHKDTVCFGNFNATNICFRMTPISFASAGSGDFVWNFGDPLDPTNRNLDSNSWEPCHAYSNMGHFIPSITIKNVCPDTTFFFTSAVSTFAPFDLKPFRDNDTMPNNYPIPPNNLVLYNIPPPVDLNDSIVLTYIGLPKTFNNLNINETIEAYVTPNNDTVYFRKTYPVASGGNYIQPTVKIPINFLIGFKSISPQHRQAVPTGTITYPYKGKYERPTFFFQPSPLILNAGNGLKDTTVMSWHMMNDILKLGFGVFVVGPRARIENPPAMILLNPGQKRQCGPRDTVDFVNTQVNYKSRHTWRRWDFDDNFAPQCTSFSRPHPGFPPVAGWANAQAQYRNSDHFFILNKVIYPGKMHCKWSFDTLPRHAYPDWDSVYLWYRYGKDFMPWNFAQFTNGALGTGQNRVAPWDSAWWGQVVYLDIKSGKWSRTQDSSLYFNEVFQETYFDSITGMNVTRDQVRFVPGGKWIRWPRIDNLPFETNNNQDLVGPYNPINMQNVPDPIAVSRGKYPYTDYNLNGQMNNTWTVTQFDPKTFDSWTLTHQTVLNTGDSMYRHAFKRSIQRCITVRQRVKDSSNNETSNPGMQYDALMLDNFDCEHENQVQLAFGQADAYGLGLSGKICQGSAANNFNAQIRFNMGQIGSFPGVVPNCGQSYILMNLDSLADRRDLTPCVLDGFTTFEGGITPGGLPRPNFNTLPDYFPFPPGPWMNPNGTVNVYHYDPFHPLFPTPLPADQEGWVTIGVAIGNGSKDTTLTVLLSTYRNNQGSYAGAGPFGPPNQQPLVLNPFGFSVTGSTFQNGARHNYQFSQATNIRPLQNTNDSLIDIIYTDANYPKCVSSVVWYHRFFRLVNINANFEEFPASCWHRGKGDSITVFYNDSIMDSIRFSAWAWGDGTVTVDSFWYKGGNVTDAFYTNGVRRVRYNIDLLENVVLDSTVWPIRASGIGANDGLRPGQKFAVVPYDTLDFCQTQIQGVPVRNPNPPTYVADTALMFMPIQHKYVRSSWEAAGRGPDASVSTTVHFIATTADCQSRIFKLMPIGVIDTFDTRKSSHNGEFDSVFCENEEVFFYDSVRYWRYDCQTTFLPDNPGRSRPRPTFAVTVFDPNTDPRALLQLDPFDFWRQAEFDPNTIKDSFTITKVLWNPGANRYDTLKRRGAVFAERMYWDFGDGNTYTGTKPSHKYNNFGRYRVRMVTMDSLGWYDTCVRWVNIVKPIARIYSPQLVYGCGQITQFTDTSYIDVGASDPGVDKIVNNQWWFGENKKDTIVPIAINRKNTQWLYRSNGYFTVKLAIETEQGCRDTAYQDVFISGPRPRFRVITDTIGCTPLKVRIINLADSIPGITPGDTPTVETIVYWGDGNQTTVLGRNDTVEHIYGDSGIYEIFVAGRDAITGQNTSCPIVYFPDTVDGFNAPIRIRVYEYPVNITGNYRYLCEGEELEITNSSDSNFTAFQYNIYDRSTDILLDSFPGNGPATVGNPIVTKRIFDTSGDYRIVMIPIGFSSNVPLAAQPNCKVTDTIDVLVSNVVADFTIDSVGIPTFKFTNTSTNAEAYEWYLYTDSTRTTIRAQKLGTLNDPNFEYNLGNEKGKFVVCLKAITADSLGSTGPCEDTTCKVIINEFTTDIKIFNVFTPNNDGANDVFKVDIEGSEEYEIFIYNRWGGLVYESTDFSKSWNGKVMNEGAESPAGVYYYIINYKLKAQDKKSVNGTVTLMK